MARQYFCSRKGGALPARDHFARPGHAHGPEGLTNLKAEMELRRTTAQRRATTYMFVASIAAAVSRSPRASRLMSPSVADDRRKESPAKAGLHRRAWTIPSVIPHAHVG